MKTLKIQKEFWDLILKGEKEYEYRKLEKGYTSGEYGVVDLETGKTLGTMILEPVNLFSKDTHYRTWIFEQFDKFDLYFIRENYLEKHDFVEYKIVSFKEFK